MAFPMSDWNDFSAEEPCRCGYDGTGVHQCHAGRDPAYPHGRCSKSATPRLVTHPVCLAGEQMKLGAVSAFYCDEHFVQAFPAEAKRLPIPEDTE